ncbi:Mitochondrial carrier protein [seawater metagenome]|uniref:Mitochondrial carrier protein n=1 Tax=seawater metagenome TaxID=1561972 RepID=A0A5E8CLA3_9ZZZZ
MDKNHIIAGSLAGLFEHITMYPFDSIKTRIQVNSFHINQLWRGMPVIGFGSIPAHALYFSSYEFVKKEINLDPKKYDIINAGLCGVIPCILHDSVMVPFDVIKQRMQISNNINNKNMIIKIYKNEGLLAFYRSYPITLLANLPMVTSFMAINENIKVFFNKREEDLTTKEIVISSFTAGTVSAILTTPIDIIKTKLQTQHDGLYKNIRHTSIKIMNQNGIKGFFKGVLPRIMYVAPSSTIGWFFYEHFKIKLKNI